MKRMLYLIRHAAAAGSLNDMARPLTERGLEETQIMGQWLHQHQIKFDRLICSPAVRAAETARRLAYWVQFAEDRIEQDLILYSGSFNGVQEALREQPETAMSLAVVGHNPTLSEIANYLAQGQVHYLSNCAIAAFETTAQTWGLVSPGNTGWLWLEKP